MKLSDAIIIISIILIIAWIVYCENLEKFLGNNLNYAELTKFDVHDFEGKWVSDDSSIELLSKNGWLWVSFNNNKFIPVRVRHLQSNSKLQIIVDDPVWNNNKINTSSLADTIFGTYDLEIIHQLPTQGDPIIMMRIKQQGHFKWVYYSLS